MQNNNRAYRLDSIDLIRGLAIVIMAIDHVRDYFYIASSTNDPMAAGAIEPDIFLTRFITHFCAPVFVFLAGTSAGLMATRKTKHELAQFLVKRGCWLVLVEMLIVSTGWTFSPFGVPELGGNLLYIMQVIWAIGASMIVLGILQYLPINIVLGLGLGIVVGHNYLDGIWPIVGNGGFNSAPFWVSLHAQSSIVFDGVRFFMVYPLIPWIGVMLFGFGSARLFTLDSELRRKTLLIAGLSLIVLFFVLRAINNYGEPNPWAISPNGTLQTAMNFMSVSKYPPSLMFLFITLGPAFFLLAFAEQWKGKFSQVLITFGRVPFLFYIAHIYLIHLLATITGILLGFDPVKMKGLFIFYPDGWGFGLPTIYLVWVLVLAMLYPLCRWFAKIKKTRKDWWLSYL